MIPQDIDIDNYYERSGSMRMEFKKNLDIRSSSKKVKFRYDAMEIYQNKE